MELEQLRNEIDKINEKIIDLVNERTEKALQIGKMKSENQIGFYRPEREKVIIDNIIKYNKDGKFPNDSLVKIFKEIISTSRNLEKKIVVAYMGPEASHSHAACIEYFGSSTEMFPVSSVSDVFFEVEKDKADFGIVPIENSYEGLVTHTLDMFIDSSLKICSESKHKITHCLMSNLDDIKKIKKIYSHPQVFAQCRVWLENNLPNVEKIEQSSTSKAASVVEWDK